MDHPFEVGKAYRNRYGRYHVLSIDDPKMRIRYEDGREIKVTIAIQAQILAGIQLQESTAVKKGARRKTKKQGGKAATKASEQEKLIAEILETDDAIFEILTRLVIPPGQLDLYLFFARNPDDYFSQQEIADAVRGSNLEGQRGVFMAFGKRIGRSPDARVRSLKPYNSLFFEHKRIGGKTCLRIRHRVVEIFESYPEFYSFLINASRGWLPEEFGSEGWENSTAVHHAQLHYFGFWERYQAEQGK